VALAKGTQQVGGCELDHSCHDPLTIKTTAVDQVYLEMDQARREAEIERITASVMDEMYSAGLLDRVKAAASGAAKTYAMKVMTLEKLAGNQEKLKPLLEKLMAYKDVKLLRQAIMADYNMPSGQNKDIVAAFNVLLSSLPVDQKDSWFKPIEFGKDDDPPNPHLEDSADK
jgi:hypothetical protein